MWIRDALGCAGSLPPPDLQHLLARSCKSSKRQPRYTHTSECIGSERKREAEEGGRELCVCVWGRGWLHDAQK